MRDCQKEATMEEIEYWKIAGMEVISREYLHDYERCLNSRLPDPYGRKAMRYTLDIIEALNDGYSISEVADIWDSQDHYDMFTIIMLAMVKNFCSRGSQFDEFIKKRYW